MFGIKRTAVVVLATAATITGGTTYAMAGGTGGSMSPVVASFNYVPQYASDYAGLTSYVSAHCMDWQHDTKNQAGYARLEKSLDAKLAKGNFYIAGQNGQLEPMVAPSYFQLTNVLPNCPKG